MRIDRIKNSKRNIVWGMIGRVVTTLLPFVLRTIMIKTIGEEYLGLSSLFTSMLSMLNLAELGLGSAMVYYMYKPVAEEKHDEICALLRLYRNLYRVIGLIVLFSGLLLIPFLDSFISGTYPRDINIVILYLIYLGDTVLSYTLFAYRQSLLTVYQRSDVIFKIQILINLLLYIIQIVILLFTKSYYAYIIVKPVFTVMNNVIVLCATKKMYPEYECKGKVAKNQIKEIGNKVKALAGHKVGTTIISSADSIVISAFLGLTMVARYGNYYTIVIAIISIMGMVVNSILAGIGNGLVIGTKEENYALFKNINFILLWIVSWCAICFLCLFQPFMILWVGEEMLLPFSSVILFVVYYYSWQCRVGVLLFKDAAGQWNADFWKPYVSAIVNLIVNIILVNIIGLNGVLISTILTMIIINIPWETHVLFKHVFLRPTREYYLSQLLQIVKTSICGGITFEICEIITFSGWPGLIIKAIICCVIPNIIYIALSFKQQELCFVKRILLKR